MRKILYIDREFKNSLGGDKNRSRYIYDVLEKNSTKIFTCIIKDNYETINPHSSFELIASKKRSKFDPDAILKFSNLSKNILVTYIQIHEIKTLVVRTIAYSELAIYAKKKIPGLNIIIDVDLILSRLMRQSWEKNRSIKSRYYYIQMLQLLKYEKYLYKNDFTFLFSNEKESTDTKNKYKNIKVKYLPNTTHIKAKEPSIGQSRVILFYGSMDSTANIDAYNYINDKVYNLIENELECNDYMIHVVGKGCDSLPASKHKRIKIIGKVDAIESSLELSKFVILPIFIGSGTNTRVIETAMAGRALVTTTLGMEGISKIDNKEYVANDAQDMASIIKKMMIDNIYTLSLANQLQKEILVQCSYEKFETTLENFLINQENISLVHVPRRFTENSWGGTETVILNSAKNLNRLGYDSKIFTSKALDINAKDKIDSIIIKRFNYFYPFFPLVKEQKNNFDAIGGNLFSFSLLWALYTNKKIDLIHLHTLKRMGGIVRSVAKWKKIPYVITLHGGYFNIDSTEKEHRKKQLENGYEWGKILGWLFGSRKVMDDAAAIITLSYEEYDKAKEKYGNKVYCIANGVDTQKFSTITKNSFKEYHNIPAEKRMILCSARIDTQKNQLLLLKAFNKLYEKQKDLHLVCLGTVSDSEYFNVLMEYTRAHNLGHVVSFIGNLTPKDELLINAYNEAEILVLPSRHEPFGMVILEAWAAKTPVVASLTGGVGKIITHDHNGLLFENGKLDSLYKNMKNLLEDIELKNKLIIQATKDVKKYDWKEIVNDLDYIYSKSLKNLKLGS